MGKTAYQKIIESHQKRGFKDGQILLALDRVWGHEITMPNGILDATERQCDFVFNPNKIKCMIDHVSPAKDTASAIQGKILREWCQKHKIEFLDVGQNGVCHAVIPEKGWILPGQTGVMGDSHTCTMGAFCAFTAGVGTTDSESAIITGLWLLDKPQKVIRINFLGNLPKNVFPKDLALAYLARLGVNGGTNAVLEFGGPVIEKLSMEGRMTLTNMAVESGATTGMCMVDGITVDYLTPVVIGHLYPSRKEAIEELSSWNSDPDCEYDKVIDIDVTGMEPLITRNYSPADVVRIDDVKEGLYGQTVNQVFIGSCTNGRTEDLEVVAYLFQKRKAKVAKGVRCIIVPATTEIWKKALRNGWLEIFVNAGCTVLNPSCAACLGMSGGVLAPGEVCVSTSNRNFPDRMGKGGMVHLASPATAVQTAIMGVIDTPSREDFSEFKKGILAQAKPTISRYVEFQPIDYKNLVKEVVKFRGPVADKEYSVFYLDKANVDTDQIIPAKYLNETDKGKFAVHCLEDAGLTEEDFVLLRKACILVSRENFGCGSSREHAVWALEGIGIKCIIAPSFARIFYNNMFNNGLLCVELDNEIINQIFKEKPEKMMIQRFTTEGNYGHLYWHDKFAKFPITSHQKRLVWNGGSIGLMLELASQFNVKIN